MHLCFSVQISWVALQLSNAAARGSSISGLSLRFYGPLLLVQGSLMCSHFRCFGTLHDKYCIRVMLHLASLGVTCILAIMLLPGLLAN